MAKGKTRCVCVCMQGKKNCYTGTFLSSLSFCNSIFMWVSSLADMWFKSKTLNLVGLLNEWVCVSVHALWQAIYYPHITCTWLFDFIMGTNRLQCIRSTTCSKQVPFRKLLDTHFAVPRFLLWQQHYTLKHVGYSLPFFGEESTKQNQKFKNLYINTCVQWGQTCCLPILLDALTGSVVSSTLHSL